MDHVAFLSCSCHSDIPAAAGMTRAERATYYTRLTRKRCCMRCRRAPDFAAGMMMFVLRRFLEIAAGSLVVDLNALGLVREHTAEIIRDFAAARQYIHFVFNLKLGYWNHPHNFK